MAKSGIYEIFCVLLTEEKERRNTSRKAPKCGNVSRKRIDRLQVAEHIVLVSHTIFREVVRLVKHIRDTGKLDTAGSMVIYRTQSLFLAREYPREVLMWIVR